MAEQETPRSEQEIFDELATVCQSPGFAHAIAMFCFRDNVVGCAETLKGEDYAKMFLQTDVDIAVAVRRDSVDGERTPTGILTFLKGTSLETILDQLNSMATPWSTAIGLQLLKLGSETANDLCTAIDRLGPVTEGMLDLARHIVEQKSGSFEPDKFEDQYETALVDLVNQKRGANQSRRRSVRAGRTSSI
jgi:hypothetical protein